MRRYAIISSASILLLLGSSLPAAAHGRRYQPAPHYLTFSFVVNPSALGYKHHLGKNLYATGDVLYQEEHSDLLIRVGGAYFVPVKILFFRLYASGGYQFSRNDGYQFPYAGVGTHFWIFFTEVIHPFQSRATPEYRLGFSIRF